MEVVIRRFDVFLVALDPVVGSEIRKTRPCLVISPDEINRHLRTVIVAPMTTKGRLYPTRVACRFRGKERMVVLDQMRAVDRARLVRRLGRISQASAETVLALLAEFFAQLFGIERQRRFINLTADVEDSGLRFTWRHSRPTSCVARSTPATPCG